MRAATVLRSVIYRTLAVALAALVVLSTIMPAPAYAANTDQQVKTVRVGWLVSNEGFQDGTPGERLSGWGYEYLQTLSYYTPGWRYEYVTGTFTELMDMLEAGEIDLMPNISYSEERAQKLLFSSNPKRSRALPSATTPALCKPSLASNDSPTKESPAHTGSMTEDPISLTRSQTTRSMPSS